MNGGRTPKSGIPILPEESPEAPVDVAPTPKSKRGRKPKPKPEILPEEPAVTAQVVTPKLKAKGGRKPKAEIPVAAETPRPKLKAKRGTAPKKAEAQTQTTDLPVEAPMKAKKRGRKPKSGVVQTASPIATPAVTPRQTRGRGQKRKSEDHFKEVPVKMTKKSDAVKITIEQAEVVAPKKGRAVRGKRKAVEDAQTVEPEPVGKRGIRISFQFHAFTITFL
jgi:hypothetical protein